MLGLAHDYQNLSQWLSEHLRPDRAAQYRLGEESCISGYANFTNQDLGQYFTKGYNVVYEKTPADVMRSTGSLLLFQHRLLAANETKGTMGERSTPTIPWYLYHVCLHLKNVFGSLC
jgi:hypothetical protein